MSWKNAIIIEAILGICILVGLAVIYINGKIVERNAKKELEERQESENRERAYLESPVSESDVIAAFQQAFTTRVTTEVDRSFVRRGKEKLTQKGAFRADYTRALRQREAEYIAEGVSAANACSYLQTHFPQLTRRDLKKALDAYFSHVNNGSDKSYQADVANGISPQLFFQAAQQMQGDMVGVYIIYNQTKNMYYVGQAKRLFFRVKQHFTGRGNGDVYADYKYGDSFLIRLVTLRESGYDDLDRLERDLIAKYHAYSHGYNKTAGNQ